MLLFNYLRRAVNLRCQARWIPLQLAKDSPFRFEFNTFCAVVSNPCSLVILGRTLTIVIRPGCARFKRELF
jgi:hypothetical protein